MNDPIIRLLFVSNIFRCNARIPDELRMTHRKAVRKTATTLKTSELAGDMLYHSPDVRYSDLSMHPLMKISPDRQAARAYGALQIK